MIGLSSSFRAQGMSLLLMLASLSIQKTTAFSATAPTSSSSFKSTKSKSPMFEYLKFDGKPTFDVIQKTQDYIELGKKTMGKIPEDMYDKDYVLRGPVIGPLTRKDLTSTQGGFDLVTAFDVDIDSFGFTVDPENPYRCLYFQRWRALHKGPLTVGGRTIEATMKEMEAPLSIFSVVWTPEAKIIYEQVGAVVDRFEGNTQGKGAIFGMLHTAGVKLPGGPGSKIFRIFQRLGHLLNAGRSFSEEKDIPSWWTSKSRGADPTDAE